MKPLFVPLLVAALAMLASAAQAQQRPEAGVFATPLTKSQLDAAAFTELGADGEKAAVAKNGPVDVIWTKDSHIEIQGVKFGEVKSPGLRYLRIGFRDAIPCESILVRGGGRLSVLKSSEAYPGNLADNSQWIPAERMSSHEVGREDYAVWVLPPGTTTRALRFSHETQPTDREPAGWLGGVWIMQGRYVNMAPQAVASTSHNDTKASLINNESDDRHWLCWNAITREESAEAVKLPPIGEEHPEWITLVWNQPTPLRGLCALWAGFSVAEAQVFTGPANLHPREAGPEQWRAVALNAKIDPYYPLNLAPNWFDFGQTVTTRAVRLKVTAISKNTHPHLKDKVMEGHNIWLGDLMALRALDNGASVASAQLPEVKSESHPPIPIHFHLASAGRVTLVIDDKSGKRIRNLVADTPFPAGDNTTWWDGLDDLGRDVDAARHGLYHVPGQLVAPGAYTVRGLVHDAFDVKYEFPVYTHNPPAWNTEDNTGAWLANHTPPQATLFVPADKSPLGRPLVYLGSYVSEGTHGLAWVDLDGKKVGGMFWVGGNWTGAPFLACDMGDRSVEGRTVFAGSVWPVDNKADPVELELRLTAITKDGAKPVSKITWSSGKAPEKGDNLAVRQMGGLAAHNGLLVASLRERNLLVFVDISSGKTLGEASVANPSGIAFDQKGRLLVLTGRHLFGGDHANLVRYVVHGLPSTPALDGGQVLVHELIDSVGLAVGPDDSIYVSDQGDNHQVRKYNSEGTLLTSIGRAGTPKAGPYDEEHMNHPAGITVDERGRLWVAENDELPKRVSVWKPDGKLDVAYYGPSEYGGGGRLDQHDAKTFFYHGMEFALDWKQGSFALKRVYFRPAPGELGTPQSPHAIRGTPEQPIYTNGHRYFTNSFNSNPTGGAPVSMLWIDDDAQKSVRPVAAIGEANDWPLMASEPFAKCWPAGIKPPGDRGQHAVSFIWTDKNGDGLITPDEVTMIAGSAGGVMFMPDGAATLTRLRGKDCVRLAPLSWDARGVPTYDFARAEVLAQDVHSPVSSGGNQAIVHPDGWTFIMNGVAPFHSHSLCGVYKGEAKWSYPDLWPGLHASHEAAIPDQAGEIIGTTRLLGNFIETPGVGPMALVNGNMGPWYVFTADGLFVTQLLQDSRIGKPWSMPQAVRGMNLNEVTPHDENFWPSATQTPDGKVYIVDGGRSSLLSVEGFASLHRLPDATVQVSETELAAAQQWQANKEMERQKSRGTGILQVAMRQAPPKLANILEDWATAEWAPIDQRGTRANFNSNSKPYDVQGALCIAGDRLYAAYRTGEPNLLRNSGEVPNAIFKTGGTLDVMLATDPHAKAGRTTAAAGDLRLSVTLVNKKPRALLYRAVSPGVKPADRVPFSSPWRTIYFDKVDDVTADLEFSADKDGNFAFSIPLATLGWHPAAGQTYAGDIGILRGDGVSTTARVYWNNKATGITADVPSEAELAPALWGKLKVVGP